MRSLELDLRLSRQCLLKPLNQTTTKTQSKTKTKKSPQTYSSQSTGLMKKSESASYRGIVTEELLTYLSGAYFIPCENGVMEWTYYGSKCDITDRAQVPTSPNC